MHATLKTIVAVAALSVTALASAQITFYENADYSGRSFNTQRQVGDFSRFGFSDRASSAIVSGGRWEVCDDVRFAGRCVVLRPGNYASLSAMGLNDRVSSARILASNVAVDDGRYAPPPVTTYDVRRRNNERLYEADVTSVRAVVGPPEQRCWIEREQVVQDRQPNVPRALAGALIGGVLGHQIGGGSGRDLATAGGVVAGAAIGARGGRNGGQVVTQDVQRCATVPASAKPDYWDVTYTFRGLEHRVQVTSLPGPTITVNRQGEPRG